MTLSERGQFGAAGRGLGPQLRSAQGEPMFIQHIEASAAGCEHSAWLDRRLRSQRFGEPAAGARHRRAAPPTLRCSTEMTISVLAATHVHRYSPGQQMRLSGRAGAKFIQPLGGLVPSTQQSGRYRSNCVSRLCQHQPGVCLTPRVLLGPKETVGGVGSVQGSLRLRGSQSAVGRHKEQFGLFCGPTMGTLDVVHCSIRLGQRIGDQSRGQQDVAPVLAEKRCRHIQRPKARGGLAKKGKRSRKIS